MLISSDQASLATRIAKVYLVMLGYTSHRSETVSVIESLLSMSSLRMSARAEIYLALAKLADNQGRLSYDEHLVKADEAYSACGNHLGLLEVDMVRHTQSRIDLDTRISKLYGLLEQCDTIEYPLLLLRVSARLSSATSAMTTRRHPLTQEQIEMELSSRRQTQDLASKIGARLAWSLNSLRYLLEELGAGNFGKVIESESLVEKMVDVPYIKGTLCSTIALAYSHTGNLSKIQHWTNLAKEYSEETGSQKFQSNTARYSFLASAHSKDGDYDKTESAALRDINTDRENSNLQGAFDKLLDLVTYHVQNQSSRIQMRKIYQWLADAKELATQLPDKEIALSKLVHYNVYVQHPLVDPDEGLEALNGALRMYSLCDDGSSVATTVFQIAEEQRSAWGRTNDVERLKQAIGSYLQASEKFESIGFPDVQTFCHYRLADCYEALGHSTDSAQDNRMTSLEHLKKAAKLLDMTRHESFTLPAIEALYSKQHMRAGLLEQQVHKMAIRLSWEIGNLDDCWNWIQMNKARSLSEMMGMSTIIPSYLLEKIQANREASQLLEDESRLVQNVESKSPELRLDERKILDNHRKLMEKIPVLEELLALRDGKSETLEGLDWLFSDNKTRVVVVDWMCLDSGILMAIVDSTRKPLILNLPFDIQNLAPEIEKWMKIVAERKSWRPTYLDRLIQPLSIHTNPGDLLILSPSALLHSVPLHALGLPDGQILIERNPIVYSSNLSILHQCFLRSSAALSTPRTDLIPALMMGVYEDAGADHEKAEVYTALKKQAQQFAGKSLCGEVTRSAARQMEQAQLIHFHGHTKPNKDILDESLVISPDTTDVDVSNSDAAAQSFEQQSDNNEDSQKRQHLRSAYSRYPDDARAPGDKIESKSHTAAITVKDLFSFNLHAPTVMLIACSSGKQEVKPGDEPLGFISAFLYAGATSVIGTLWPIRSVDGRNFTEAFYQLVLKTMKDEEKDGTSNKLIDLALAVQHSILQILTDPEFEEPYHWAGFMLHGAWNVPSFSSKAALDVGGEQRKSHDGAT